MVHDTTAARRVAFEARLRHWAPRLPAGGAFSGLTACEFWGLWVPPRPDGPLDVAVPATTRGSRRTALSVTRVTGLPRPCVFDGIPVVPVEEAVLLAAADLGLLDTVVLVDAVLALRPASARLLGGHAALRRRGAPILRRALWLADDRSESPWETLLRMFHRSIGVPVTPQVSVFDSAGVFLARADLLIDGTRTLQEYDGKGHLEPDQYRDDRRRDAALTRAGFIRHGWTAPDLLRDFERVMLAADLALARKTEWTRLTRWREFLADSWFASRKVTRNVA